MIENENFLHETNLLESIRAHQGVIDYTGTKNQESSV